MIYKNVLIDSFDLKRNYGEVLFVDSDFKIEFKSCYSISINLKMTRKTNLKKFYAQKRFSISIKDNKGNNNLNLDLDLTKEDLITEYHLVKKAVSFASSFRTGRYYDFDFFVTVKYDSQLFKDILKFLNNINEFDKKNKYTVEVKL